MVPARQTTACLSQRPAGESLRGRPGAPPIRVCSAEPAPQRRADTRAGRRRAWLGRCVTVVSEAQTPQVTERRPLLGPDQHSLLSPGTDEPERPRPRCRAPGPTDNRPQPTPPPAETRSAEFGDQLRRNAGRVRPRIPLEATERDSPPPGARGRGSERHGTAQPTLLRENSSLCCRSGQLLTTSGSSISSQSTRSPEQAPSRTASGLKGR